MIKREEHYGGSQWVSNADVTLNSHSPRVVVMKSSSGRSVRLPDATKLPLGGPQHVIINDGNSTVAIRDASNNLIFSLSANQSATISLVSNSTVNGEWQHIARSLVTPKAVQSQSRSGTLQELDIAPTPPTNVDCGPEEPPPVADSTVQLLSMRMVGLDSTFDNEPATETAVLFFAHQSSFWPDSWVSNAEGTDGPSDATKPIYNSQTSDYDPRYYSDAGVITNCPAALDGLPCVLVNGSIFGEVPTAWSIHNFNPSDWPSGAEVNWIEITVTYWAWRAGNTSASSKVRSRHGFLYYAPQSARDNPTPPDEDWEFVAFDNAVGQWWAGPDPGSITHTFTLERNPNNSDQWRCNGGAWFNAPWMTTENILGQDATGLGDTDPNYYPYVGFVLPQLMNWDGVTGPLMAITGGSVRLRSEAPSP